MSVIIDASTITGLGVGGLNDNIVQPSNLDSSVLTVSSTYPSVSSNPAANGAMWVNSTTGERFVCTDNTSGNNVWIGNLGSYFKTKSTTVVNIFNDGSCKALYQFENNVIDTSGNYNGTATGMTYVAGKYGQSGNFTGWSSYPGSKGSNFTTVNSLPTLGANQCYSFWVYITASNAHALLAIGNNAYNYTFHMRIDGSMRPHITRSGSFTSTSTLTVPLNSWTHVVFNFNNGTTSWDCWVNGVKNTVSTAFNFGGDPSGVKVFGGAYDSNYNSPGIAGGMSGYMDQIRIFNRSLNDTEINILYLESL